MDAWVASMYGIMYVSPALFVCVCLLTSFVVTHTDVLRGRGVQGAHRAHHWRLQVLPGQVLRKPPPPGGARRALVCVPSLRARAAAVAARSAARLGAGARVGLD